jgi:hypothetical protein
MRSEDTVLEVSGSVGQWAQVIHQVREADGNLASQSCRPATSAERIER